ncbi:DNA primase large subunit Spp2 [Mucor circinelloides]
MSTRLPLQSRAARPKFQNKRAIFGDDEDEEERVNDERILGIEDNKVKEAEPKKEVAPLSISPLPNADWRSSAKHKKELFLPATAKQPVNGSIDDKPEVLQQNASSFGLQIQKKKQVETIDANGNVESITVEQETTTSTTTNENAPKTLEERAIEAIIKDSMGQGDNDDDEGPKKVIHVDETMAFRDDYEKRPDETTMEEYEHIPVEEFGAALLRGLGWSEGEGIGRNRKNAPAPPPAPVKQREALLGLGAKPEDADVKTDDKQKYKNRRAAYEYKDTSLFKKISKRKYEEEEVVDEGRDRSRSSSRHSDRSSSSRRDRDDEKRKRRRSRSRDSNSSSRSHHSSSSHSHRRRRRSYSRSRSPVSRSSGSGSSSRRR